MKNLSIIALLALTIVACSPKVLTTPSQADVNRASSMFPDYTLAELNEGKSLYMAKCGTCHSLKNPLSKTVLEWKNIVPEMTKKANKNKKNIDPKTQDAILKYLVTMCSAPAAK